jgi:hypothetical protein
MVTVVFQKNSQCITLKDLEFRMNTEVSGLSNGFKHGERLVGFGNPSGYLLMAVAFCCHLVAHIYKLLYNLE